jgi:hypothetical protein
MRIDRLLRRSISIIVAPCFQEKHDSKERSLSMESNYLVIEDLVQTARKQRSEHLGVLISAGLEQCYRLFSAILANNRPQTATWRVLPP